MYFMMVSVFLIAISASLNLVEAAPRDGDVIFNPSMYSVQIPNACMYGKPYCFEKGDNYPDDKIEELLKDMLKLEVVTPATAPQPQQDDWYNHRSGNFEELDCPTNSTGDLIYYINDVTGKIRVVVQSPEKFVQRHTMKWCQKEGRITSGTNHFVNEISWNDYNIECVNTKLNVDFFVLSDLMDKIEVAQVDGGIPVCCKCRYSKL